VFVDIAEDHHESSKVQQLLDITGNLPLAVSLMANVVGYEGCDQTLSRWNEENTHLLSNGYDQRSSLDISIMLSYSSPRMTCGAQELLSLLSMLPDGLSEADLVQSKLPLENILACKSTLIKVSLVYCTISTVGSVDVTCDLLGSTFDRFSCLFGRFFGICRHFLA
jgi:hypothetical protein